LSFIEGNVQIRKLSELTGVPAKTTRYYEEIELLPPAARKPNGYREHSQADVERLK
jgi:DNA-binding transcriptional MerR regulator